MKEKSEEKVSLSLLEWESQMMDAAMMKPSESSVNDIINHAKKVMCGVCKEEIKEGQMVNEGMHLSCKIQYDILIKKNGKENIS